MMKYRYIYLTLLIYIPQIIFLNPVFADEIQIISDKLKVDRILNQSIFTGNVYAKDENFQIWSDKLIIKSNINGDGIETIQSFDQVKINYGNMVTLSDEAIFEPSKRILTLKGNVVAIEENNEIKCDELILDIENSTSIMKSDLKNRVQVTITTKK
tara:strand:+ start:1494 stop:1961 length:468 start_codon:yes stop_codon:yes gene_type:complete